jgi:4-amino-4-deoxy-L-arabinose transferase-like glycosyltransferase
VLALGAWPWLLAIAGGWLASLRPPAGRGFSAALFLALWALVVFGFFSASGSKLPPYILPLVPALAVLAGDFLARRTGSRLLGRRRCSPASGAILLGFAAWWIFTREGTACAASAPAYVPWLVGRGAGRARRQRRRGAAGGARRTACERRPAWPRACWPR